MKRRVDDTTKIEGLTPNLLTQRSPHSTSNLVSTYPSQGIKTEPTLQQYPVQTSYVTMPSITTSTIKRENSCGLQSTAPPHGGILVQSHRHNKLPNAGGGVTPPTVGGANAGAPQFQRLKVEDALSYLDQVKYKFNSQPQVYNDFLEIMKEFKSQCIDTPGVIARVSHLFKGYPELISGFNTFLPPGYKIEVQAHDTGYSLQVSVSNPLGHQTMTEIPPLTPTQPQSVVVTNQSKIQTVYGTASLNAAIPNVAVKPGSERVIPVASGIPLAATTPPCNVVQGAAVALTGVANSTPTLITNQNNACLIGTNNHQAMSITALSNQQNSASTNQPVEFNHAINYVNKIKNRFQGQPDKYKKFLEILHTYQKEQKNSGSTGGIKHLTEAEVYSQVAQLFENHDDLLVEFGQFLPDATSHNSLSLATLSSKINERKANIVNSKFPSGTGRCSEGRVSSTSDITGNKSSPQGSSNISKSLSGRESGSNKRSSSDLYQSERGSSVSRSVVDTPHSPGAAHAPAPPIKRQKLGSSSSNYILNFETLKRALRNSTNYGHFLTACHLYTLEIISKAELFALVSPLLAKHPTHYTWFKNLLSVSETAISDPSSPPMSHHQPHHQDLSHHLNLPAHHAVPLPVPPLPLMGSYMNDHHLSQMSHRERGDSRSEILSTTTADIDFTSCKRIGASYCALPKSLPPPKCSGRTALCRQVLNDTWVSFPTWSEDSTFVTSRKTQYEEYIYRCEDERFELDLIIECNAALISSLEGIHRKMSRMAPEELTKFRLDDTLGGRSPVINYKALKRLYGDKASDMLDSLKKHPAVAVPMVLKRLKAKENEWRQAQKGFNKIWREQNEKFYLKSLDHQGINFKQNDLKTLRSKSLYSEIEAVYDERAEGNSDKTGPHLTINYQDKVILDDAANLLIHHVKRQTTIHKQDKTRIKQLLKHYLPDMFHHPRQELSDDERESDEKSEVDSTSNNKENDDVTGGNSADEKQTDRTDASETPTPKDISRKNSIEDESRQSTKPDDIKLEPRDIKMEVDDEDTIDAKSPKIEHGNDDYSLFYGNNHWYLFMRLHQILCERLSKMSERSVKIAEQEALNSVNRKESTAATLKLKPNEHFSDCYGTMLEMVKSVLDCSMEIQTYEDTLRNIFGIHAYIGFTLDRVVSYAVRQLQHMVSDENAIECFDLYTQYKLKGATGGPTYNAELRSEAESAYFKAVSASLAGETCYKICIHQKDCKVTFEMLDTEGDGDEEDGADGDNLSIKGGNEGNGGTKWSEFPNETAPRLTGNSSSGSDKADSGVCFSDRERWALNNKPIYLHRNLNRRKYQDESKFDDRDGSDKCLGLSNDKNVIVAHDNFLYKQGSFSKAKQIHCSISRKKYGKFSTWHSSWVRCNTDREENDNCLKWFNGKGTLCDWKPCRTTVLPCDPEDTKAPYRPYTRWTVQQPLPDLLAAS